MIWAKIFNIKRYNQLLVTKSFDDDGTVGSGKIIFEARINGSQGITSIEVENVDQVFKQINHHYAATIFNEILETKRRCSSKS